MLKNKSILLTERIPFCLSIFIYLGSLDFPYLRSNFKVSKSSNAIANTKILARSEPLDDQVPKQSPNPTLEQQRQQLRERQEEFREQHKQEWSQQQQLWRNQQKQQQQESRENRRQDRERIYQRNEIRREEERNRQRRQLIIQPRH